MERDTGSGRSRTLVLVKHAMPIVEPRVPPSRWRLSEGGRRQSAVLAGRLKDYGLEHDIDAYEFWYRLGLPSFYSLSLPDFGLQDVVFDVDV